MDMNDDISSLLICLIIGERRLNIPHTQLFCFDLSVMILHLLINCTDFQLQNAHLSNYISLMQAMTWATHHDGTICLIMEKQQANIMTTNTSPNNNKKHATRRM